MKKEDLYKILDKSEELMEMGIYDYDWSGYITPDSKSTIEAMITLMKTMEDIEEPGEKIRKKRIKNLNTLLGDDK